MRTNGVRYLVRALAVPPLIGALVVAAHGAATITVQNDDSPGEGFNDPTPVLPIGGNPGRTLGDQRLRAVQLAADLVAALGESDVEILVGASFDPLLCQTNKVILAQATPAWWFPNVPGAPHQNTWYPLALANKLAGRDLCTGTICAGDPDIIAWFNSKVGTTACSGWGNMYLGLDANPPAGAYDLVSIALHEIVHGLGFVTGMDLQTGEGMDGRNDVFMLHLRDSRTGKQFPEMTNRERAAASRAGSDLRWNGPAVVAASGYLTAGADSSGRVKMQVGESIAHFSLDLEPDELMEPSALRGRAVRDAWLTTRLLVDIGWGLPTPTPTAAAPEAPLCGGDTNRDNQVTINELIAAVNNSLRGCPSSSTTTAPRMAIAHGPAGVIIVVGETEGAPGDFVSFDVTLGTGGLEVAGAQNDIVFDPSTPIAAAENGNPQCWVNPDIDKSATAFRFQPPGCEGMGIGLCTGIRAVVLSLSNLDPIPDGSVMYGCEVAIATDAPAEIFPLVNDNVVAVDSEGIKLPTLGEDGAVTVVGGPTPTCGGDTDRDNQVTINELIAAVNNSLRGCPSQ